MSRTAPKKNLKRVTAPLASLVGPVDAAARTREAFAAKHGTPPPVAAPLVKEGAAAPEVNADGVDVASEAYIIAHHPAHRHTRAALGLPEPGE